MYASLLPAWFCTEKVKFCDLARWSKIKNILESTDPLRQFISLKTVYLTEK